MPTPPVTDADIPGGNVRVRASLPSGERRSPWAVALSFLLHVVLIALALRLTAEVVMPKESPIGNAIQFVLQGGGGGGGSGGHAFVPSKPPPPTVVAPPVVPDPLPVIVPTVVPPPAPTPPAASKDTSSAPASVAGTGTGGGTGGGAGTGTGTGTGSGVGPGSGSGTGGGNGGGRGGFPPETKQMILPPESPKSLKGKSVDVTFWVDSAGVVTNIAVAPPIKDRKYAGQFDDVMRGFRFTPARDAAGKRVAGTLVVIVTF